MSLKKVGLFGGVMALAVTLMTGVSAQAQEKMDKMDMSRYGGPVYTGAPTLAVTASLVKAGGGPGQFSAVKALTAMVGEDLVKAEVAKLTKQYGEEKVNSFVQVQNFAVEDSLKIATAAGVKLPKANLSGKKLASTLLTAGMDQKGVFYTEFLLDKAVTHKIHTTVMDDIDAKFGADADTNYHTISNQLWFDVGQALGNKTVKLAEMH